eukprot:1733478-Lingulodinium_polyedra.AAC.1
MAANWGGAIEGPPGEQTTAAAPISGGADAGRDVPVANRPGNGEKILAPAAAGTRPNPYGQMDIRR